MEPPTIVVTLSNPERSADPAGATLKNERYVDALRRAGAQPMPLDDRTDPQARAAAFARMDGLLITGGADVDPARYGEPAGPRTKTDRPRDELDEAAFRAAQARRVPVLGICRGLQAINVFAGGSLVQHLEGHESDANPATPPTRHRLELVAGTRLAKLFNGSDDPDDPPGREDLKVNSFHHQAVSPEGLAGGLRIAGTASHPEVGELVEALESADPERWLVGVQCHPERTESSPPVFEELWRDFVEASSRARATRSSGRDAAPRAG